jgi:hypothetical protein
MRRPIKSQVKAIGNGRIHEWSFTHPPTSVVIASGGRRNYIPQSTWNSMDGQILPIGCDRHSTGVGRYITLQIDRNIGVGTSANADSQAAR